MRDELWCLIQAAATTIRHMLGIVQCTRNSWRHRAQFCIWTNGENSEQML
jgi:hypothetical protein